MCCWMCLYMYIDVDKEIVSNCIQICSITAGIAAADTPVLRLGLYTGNIHD